MDINEVYLAGEFSDYQSRTLSGQNGSWIQASFKISAGGPPVRVSLKSPKPKFDEFLKSLASRGPQTVAVTGGYLTSYSKKDGGTGWSLDTTAPNVQVLPEQQIQQPVNHCIVSGVIERIEGDGTIAVVLCKHSYFNNRTKKNVESERRVTVKSPGGPFTEAHVGAGVFGTGPVRAKLGDEWRPYIQLESLQTLVV